MPLYLDHQQNIIYLLPSIMIWINTFSDFLLSIRKLAFSILMRSRRNGGDKLKIIILVNI